MDHHVIDDFRRSHDKPETERQTIALRAGAPASLGRCYPHASMNQSQHGTIVFKTSADMTHGPVFIPADKIIFSHALFIGTVEEKTLISQRHSPVFQRVVISLKRIGAPQIVEQLTACVASLPAAFVKQGLTTERFVNPVSFFFHKAADFLRRCKARRINGYTQVSVNLQRDGFFSFSAADDRILHFHNLHRMRPIITGP